MPYLLDTNILLHLVRGKNLGIHIQKEFSLFEEKVRPLISIVTCGEIWSLAEQKDWEEEKRNFLKRTLEALTLVDINHPSTIQAYVEIDAFSHKHPKGAIQMGKNDLWIAACTKFTKTTLLTTDKDFLHLTPEQIPVVWIDPSAYK